MFMIKKIQIISYFVILNKLFVIKAFYSPLDICFFIHSMKIIFTFLLCFVFYAQLVCAENVKAKDTDEKASDLLCDICIDVVTDLDQWLTSDATMDEIIYFVEGVQKTISNVVKIILLQLCRAIGEIIEGLELMCNELFEDYLPDIINGLVDENLNPSEVCARIGACYTPPPTTTSIPSRKLAQLLAILQETEYLQNQLSDAPKF